MRAGATRIRRLGWAIGALCLVAALWAPAGAGAATLTVNTTADTNDAGGCVSLPTCSLREAVNIATDGDQINLPAGQYVLTQGEIFVDPTVAVNGAGARNTVIDGNEQDRIFNTDSNQQTVTIRDLTLTRGHADAFSGGDGGAIFGPGNLVLERVHVTGNEATFSGGGISLEFESAIPITSSLTMVDSTVANNHVRGGAFNGLGGGIAAFGDATIVNSTITGNSVANPGLNEGGGLFVARSAFSAEEPTATLLNTTITGNSISGGTPSGPVSNFGGGLSGDAIGGAPVLTQLIAQNTIIANNTVDGAREDCGLVSTNASTNNLSSDSSCGFNDAGSRRNVDPELGSLRANGGPTDTMLPAYDSPAVDAGANDSCPPTDQRGVARPNHGICDIGAVELEFLANLAVRQKVRPKPAEVGEKLIYTLTLRNRGPAPTSGVVLRDRFPESVKVPRKARGSLNRFGAGRKCKLRQLHKVVCRFKRLPVGKRIRFPIIVRPTETGRLRNVVKVRSALPDPNRKNNKRRTKVGVKPAG